ncbi:MAG: DUF2268 domain-containing putative Zn-dependent protease [Rhizomicrobium sp.]
MLRFNPAVMPRRLHDILSVIVLITMFAGGANAATTGRKHSLDVVDRVPQFETFYRDAGRLDEAQRWSLWQKEYGIAAVPPTPQGQKMARTQLDAAWPRYRGLIPHLPGLEARSRRNAYRLFAAVNRLYGTGDLPIHTRVVLFVGQFDGNEFTVPAMKGNPPTVVMPVEDPKLDVDLAHELSHSVNFQLADVKNSFGAPIGETVFLEGLAMHASKALVPGLPDTAYTEVAGENGWLSQCIAHKHAIMKGIGPFLDQSGANVASKFTFGVGTAGMHRELYCAGWIIVGNLLASGKTFPELARIPEGKMVATVERQLSQ